MASSLKIHYSLKRPGIISHRGNLTGPNPDRENHPKYLEAALKGGFGIEFDVWFVDGQWALGHDEPKYAVTFSYFLELARHSEGDGPKVWMHLKNLEAVQELKMIDSYADCGLDAEFEFSGRRLGSRLNYFWHQDDDITITKHGHIWAHPMVKTIPVGCAWVVPEGPTGAVGVLSAATYPYDYDNPNWTRAEWVCVDYPEKIRDMFASLDKSLGYFTR